MTFQKDLQFGKTYEQLAADMERDYFMSAEEARIYGLVDEVINKR